MTLVEIDLNVRTDDDRTFSRLSDVSGPIAVGETVIVTEPESGITGQGRVAAIDVEKALVYLDIDWEALT